MRFGLHVPQLGAFGDPGDLVDLAGRAEAVGWDGFFVWDHVMHAGDPPACDPWVALGAIAASTELIRLGPLVTPLPRRRPWKVAREAVDRRSPVERPRRCSGVGIGTDHYGEFTKFAEPATDDRMRAARLDEALDSSRRCGAASGSPTRARTTRRPTSCRSRVRSRSPGSRSGARPRGRTSLPLRRAARWDGVVPVGRLTPDDVGALLDEVDEHRTTEDRSTSRCPATHAIETDIAEYEDAGVTWWLASIRPSDALEASSCARRRRASGDRVIPVAVDDVTPEWLSQVLGLDVVATDVLDQHSGTTGRARLALTYGSGGDGECPPSLFVKLPPFDERQRAVRRADRARHGRGPLLPRRRRRRPDARAGRALRRARRRRRYVMLLEDLEASGCRFPRPGDDDVVAVVDSIVTELAALHAEYWEHPALGRELSWVSEGMRIAFGSGGRFMQKALDQFANDMPPAYRRLGELYVAHTRRRSRSSGPRPPHTLAHGDPHMGNLFVDGTRAGFFDWGMVMRKAGMWDVAYVICNSVPTEIRRANEHRLDRRLPSTCSRRTGSRSPPTTRGSSTGSTRCTRGTPRCRPRRWAAAGNPKPAPHAAMLRTTTAIEDLDSIGLLEEMLRT